MGGINLESLNDPRKLSTDGYIINYKIQKPWKRSLVFIKLVLKLLWWQDVTWTDLRIFIVLILLSLPIPKFAARILVYLITRYLITLLEIWHNYVLIYKHEKNSPDSVFWTLLDSKFCCCFLTWFLFYIIVDLQCCVSFRGIAVIQLYLFFFKWFSHLDYCTILSRVPCDLQ